MQITSSHSLKIEKVSTSIINNFNENEEVILLRVTLKTVAPTFPPDEISLLLTRKECLGILGMFKKEDK